MEASMVTIGEGAKKTGRSASTIRRLIKTIVERESHPDRSAVLPSSQDAKKFKERGVNFTWKIRQEILDREFHGTPVQEKKSSEKPGDDILSILRRELEFKNEQLQKQWDIIHSLNERLREGNILMGSLQKRLAPPSADAVLEGVTVKPFTKASTKASKKPSMKGNRKKPLRKGLFSWLGF